MTTTQPPVSTTATAEPDAGGGSIFFELERFEPRDGERLELSGRWFGIRGRRFVRPTLTLVSGSERVRLLADLEDKPWAAADGEAWQAAFAWNGEAEVREAELAVAPDLAVRLPGPGKPLRPPKRLLSLPRERPSTEAMRPLPTPPEAKAPAEPSPAPLPGRSTATEALPSPGELERLRDEVAALRAELERQEAEGARMGSELDAAIRQRDDALGARDTSLADRDTAFADRDAARASRDAALAEREKLTRERDAVVRQRERMAAESERMAAERDQAMSAHAAGLVMREAVRAATVEHRREAHWLQRSLAVALLLAVLAALGLVLHVL